MSRYIDADALNDAMYYEAFENDASYNERNPMAKWDSGLWIRYKLFENTIDEAPTIEPKSGEWIFVESKISDRKLKKCSVCGLRYVSLKPDNYCPNCGARMKGADDEGF